MKKFVILSFLAVCTLGLPFFIFSQETFIYPVYDSVGMELPRNFRVVSHAQELKNLRISGSGQFSEQGFINLIRFLSVPLDKFIVLDLRQESHGFIDGQSISWTDGNYNYANIAKTKSEIELDESQRLKQAVQAHSIVLDPLGQPLTLVVQLVQTERHLVESYDATYLRLPVTDHNCPTHEVLDQFIDLVKNLSADQWIHLHCKGGKGRTTTFLALFDMMHNARDVSFEEILARQKAIGGIDLIEIQKKDSERSRAAKERLELLQNFYLYCQQVPNFQISWSDWVIKKA